MQTTNALSTCDRDTKVVDAIESALLAMRLTDGCTITLLGLRGRLNFEREIDNLVEALNLLEQPARSRQPQLF